MSELTELYLNEKPVKALLMIYNSEGETFCREISEDIESTYAHTVKIISKFKKMGVVETREKGRKKMLSLTPEGERQAELLNDLVGVLEETQPKKRGKIGDSNIFDQNK